MPMVPFVDKFPELGARETRSIFASNQTQLPAGQWSFLEFYCNEPGCDCRRVIISVLRPETGWSKVWATIGYGWESLDFYRKWGHGMDDDDFKGPYLDVLNAQSEYSEVLLGLFREILESPDYVERLRRHYRMFRKTVDEADRGVTISRKHRWKRRRV